MSVKVSTLENELQFQVDAKKHCIEFFGIVSRNLGIHETWFFGIFYRDSDNEDIWIDTSKKPLKSLKSQLQKLKYRVKFYPEDVEEELLEDITIRYFFLQVKAAILQDAIYCPPDTCVLLASYAIQAKYGDYNGQEFQNGFLSKQKLLPERVYTQHNLEKGVWEENILSLWKKHGGMLKEDAMLEYLKLAQNLEMYGVVYFNIKNKKGTPLLLGVTSLGLNIYKPEDKLNPNISFPWSEIQNINFRDKKFTIKSTDKKSAGFIFFAADAKVNKRILNLGVGNHSLYIRRRKPDTLEILQMKSKAAEAKKNKLAQSSKLKSEIAARKLAEQREKEYQDQIQAMKEEMENSQLHLHEAQKTIQKLKEQLEELQKAKDNLEKQQQELRHMMQRLEDSKNMEAAERQKLENEIRQKQMAVEQIQEEVQQKDREAQLLQEQIEAARIREEELKQQHLEDRLRREREEQNLETPPMELDSKLPDLVSVNETLREQLKKLQEQLEQSRDETKDTELDKIHRDNVKEGRDKYKTLAEIRKGNTVRRVDLFENL